MILFEKFLLDIIYYYPIILLLLLRVDILELNYFKNNNYHCMK
jgi:hypothetical protein